jgi:hypothetical protein
MASACEQLLAKLIPKYLDVQCFEVESYTFSTAGKLTLFNFRLFVVEWTQLQPSWNKSGTKYFLLAVLVLARLL